MKRTISIDNQDIEIEANALTMLIYEDSFKGRRFLKDLEQLKDLKDPADVSFSVLNRYLWVVAKTANKDIPSMYEWIAQFSISGILSSFKSVIEILSENMTSSEKKAAAAAAKK